MTTITQIGRCEPIMLFPQDFRRRPVHRRWAKFRNPSLGWRVFVTAMAFALPGVLLGLLLSLLVGQPTLCLIVGRLVGAVAGAVIESSGR